MRSSSRPTAPQRPEEASSSESIEFVDGRRKRSEDSRARISQAFLTLVAEGIVTPTADEVASRAGVGLRSVFRHFTDMESLYREMVTHSQRLASRMTEIDVSVQDWPSALEQIIDARASAYDELMPYQIAARVHQHESAYLRLQQEHFADFQRAALLESFPKELLKDKSLLEALNMALSFDTWVRLRREQRLSRAAARKVVGLTCRALLQEQAAEPRAKG